MAITINTTKYYTLHLRQPKGIGCWAFSFGRDGDTMFAPSTLSYSEARAWARIHARNVGASTVYVCG